MKRAIRVFGGFSLILGGIALLVLPGPGILTIFAGISLIASEFVWASRISIWAKKKAAQLGPGEAARPSISEDQTG